VRPNLTSRPPEHILDECRRLVDRGYRELVLTGVHVGHYGVDFRREQPKSDGVRLSWLIQQIARLPGEFRVRLSSVEATEVTRELIDVMVECEAKVTPHLHLSLQSGSETVLRRMRRRGAVRRVVDRCHWVRERLDRPAFTADIIVGFPGETDRHFDETCQVVREIGFSKMHIFPFSPRRGTPAAEMPDQVPEQVKRQRRGHLAEMEAELRASYFDLLTGRRLQVLVESPLQDRPGYAVGTSCRYAPVELPVEQSTFGRLVDVIAGQTLRGRIQAEPLA
jgi:threonylcarbamoyladenosine tRNA methylthiotransferase MtaB